VRAATATDRARAAVRFELPPGRIATRPPEERGLARDEVRLLVATPGPVQHLRFRQLPEVLDPGDLLVVNTSATVPAALDATRQDGRPVVVHVAGPVPGSPVGSSSATGAMASAVRPDADATAGPHIVELRRLDGFGPVLDAEPGERLTLASGGRLRLVAAVDPPHRRLWAASFSLDGPLEDLLERDGRPVAYGYLEDRYELAVHQPAVARHPGSAEMASGARPLTPQVVTDLVTRGINVAPVVLHAGLSSLEPDEAPRPERFEVPAVTARLIAHTRRHRGRVIAVGTTTTRALETVATSAGQVRPGRGWTDLVLGPDRPTRVVDGLVTGWHAAEASHLLLLEAVAGADLVQRAYEAALAGPYLWHEFGDSCLLLPDR
jgi:S-adenosylmethionine:tRNA ribosyltransferase-isomerase